MLSKYHNDVRTTLTLEEDVAQRIKKLSQKTGKAFKQLVNELLRHALTAPKQQKPNRPFVVRARPLHMKQGMQIDNIGELLETLD